MTEKINSFLAGWPMTIVGGVFLLASFILPRAGQPWGENLAWVCVVICGLPLLYLAVLFSLLPFAPYLREYICIYKARLL